MTIRSLGKILAAGLLIITLCPAAHAQLIATTVGTGTSASYVLIEAVEFDEPLLYEYRYDYDAENPFDSYELLVAIDNAVSDLSFGFVNYGSDESPNYFLNSITYLAITLTNTPFPDVGPYWAQWVSGGEAGYPVATAISAADWTYGSGLSIPYRIVQPGSSDGLVFEEDMNPPSIAPVPEPSAGLLVLSGLVLTLWLVKKRHAAQGV